MIFGFFTFKEIATFVYKRTLHSCIKISFSPKKVFTHPLRSCAKYSFFTSKMIFLSSLFHTAKLVWQTLPFCKFLELAKASSPKIAKWLAKSLNDRPRNFPERTRNLKSMSDREYRWVTSHSKGDFCLGRCEKVLLFLLFSYFCLKTQFVGAAKLDN